MQQGLNIGIGAWIAQQAGVNTLPVLPASAIAFSPRALSLLETPEDWASAGELSHLANRVVGAGCAYDSDPIPTPLWTLHENLLNRMEVAVSTLSTAERNALAAADTVLLAADGLTPSPRYQLYLEYKHLHEELVLQHAPTEAISFAFSEWVTFGHKQAVEEALATKTRLSRNTTLLTARQDVQQIDLALQTSGSEVPFAPTFFAPVSASSAQHWLEAEVDLQVLEDALPPEAPWNLWRQFRANRTGSVRLRFAVLELLRPWFSADLYAARDWKLPSHAGEEALVADGIGKTGKLPSYLSRVYVAQVLDVRLQSADPPAGTTPPLPVVIHAGVLLQHSFASGVVKPLFNTLPRTLNPDTVRLLPAMTIPLKPVVKTRPAWNNMLLAQGVLTQGVAGKLARIHKLDSMAASGRLQLANQLLEPVPANTPAPVPQPPPQASTYIVGFGRTHLPYCPDPNPHFQWSPA